MMRDYDPKEIEPKWQAEWEKKGLAAARDFDAKPKFYALIEFPYPSGEGLHVGHLRPDTAMDVIARKRRMDGQNVLYPIGWDAFGLPTENYAIKTGIHPKVVTKNNTDIFRQQLKSLGFSFDWSREVNTSDPNYYKWTQWIFLQLFKKGLAYKKKTYINWCLSCKIGLANEEVIAGKCERCGGETEKREKEQWMLAITKYADRLYADLDRVDYLEQIKTQQRNWIGPSEGSMITFKVVANGKSQEEVKVFTTRVDTLFGVTYVVLAPEHSLVDKLIFDCPNREEIGAYVSAAKHKADLERTAEDKEKTGVEMQGVKVINPATGEEVPVWVADYVLGDYGTGAVMAVPAHDTRDFAFAKKYNLPVKEVIAPLLIDTGSDAPRPDLPFVERDSVLCIVKHWNEDKYLRLIWKKFDWRNFIVGGIDEGEDIQAAAIREIKEETGYTNLKLISEIGEMIHNRYFAAHKNQNRHARFRAFYFELAGPEQEEVGPEEQELFTAVWQTPAEIEASFASDVLSGRYFWRLFRHGATPYVDKGILKNSGKFDGMTSEEAMKPITEMAGGQLVTTYKMRDWVFSRQRYWGEPIPMVYCGACAKKTGQGWVPVPEDQLPVTLPNVEKYQPTDTGESPLANIKEWVETTCPVCGGAAQRETDTMPNWAGSSWYYLRYIDPHNDEALADRKKLDYWGQVDWYNGGMEHTTLHLLYSRFWHKFLFDIGVVPHDEPYAKRTAHGMVLGEGGIKMSKSKGNVINPNELVGRFGADALRVYIMFMGPFDQAIPWSENSLVGCRRFLERVWRLAGRADEAAINPELETLLHQTIAKVGKDIETMSFNTAISALMILANNLEKLEKVPKGILRTMLILLAPFAPHLTEELWHELGGITSLHEEAWPQADGAKAKSAEVKIIVQINGRVRASLVMPADLAEEKVREAVLADEEVKKWLNSNEIKKIVVVPNKLVSLVI